MYVQGERLVNLNGPELERRINNCSIVRVIHVYKESQKGYVEKAKKLRKNLELTFQLDYRYAHLHFGTIAESSKFFNTYAVNMNIFCPLLPIQVKPALTKGKAVLYVSYAT